MILVSRKRRQFGIRVMSQYLLLFAQAFAYGKERRKDGSMGSKEAIMYVHTSYL